MFPAKGAPGHQVLRDAFRGSGALGGETTPGDVGVQNVLRSSLSKGAPSHLFWHMVQRSADRKRRTGGLGPQKRGWAARGTSWGPVPPFRRIGMACDLFTVVWSRLEQERRTGEPWAHVPPFCTWFPVPPFRKAARGTSTKKGGTWNHWFHVPPFGGKEKEDRWT